MLRCFDTEPFFANRDLRSRLLFLSVASIAETETPNSIVVAFCIGSAQAIFVTGFLRFKACKLGFSIFSNPF